MTIIGTARGVTEPAVIKRQKIESRIASAVVKAGLKAGYELAVSYDRGTTTEGKSTSYRAIVKALGECDEDHLLFYKNGKCTGWVYFVYGNEGWTVIADYTTNLESVLAGPNKLATSLDV